jgi:hypothetical protein
MRICKNCLGKDFIGSNVEFDLKLIQREKIKPRKRGFKCYYVSIFYWPIMAFSVLLGRMALLTSASSGW